METPSDRGPVYAVVLAFVIMVAVAAGIYFLVPHKITAITVSNVDLFAPHTVYSAAQGGSVQVLGEQPQSEDDLYVVPHISITNKLRQPIIINGWSATVTFADGSTLDSTYVAKSELPRLEQIFPKVTALASNPIGDEDQISPGATETGSMVLLFPNTTEDKWNAKRSAELTIELHDHQTQTIKLP